MASCGLGHQFCHKDARQVADFSLPITALNGQTTPRLAEKETPVHKRLRCALFHEATCICPDSISFSAVRSCPRCHTDYAVNIVPDAVPGWPGVRLLVFTTWKFLGEGNPRDHYWRSHSTSALPHRIYGLGYMYSTYESRPSRDYVYKINIEDIQARVTLARLTRTDVLPEYMLFGALHYDERPTLDGTPYYHALVESDGMSSPDGLPSVESDDASSLDGTPGTPSVESDDTASLDGPPC